MRPSAGMMVSTAARSRFPFRRRQAGWTRGAHRLQPRGHGQADRAPDERAPADALAHGVPPGAKERTLRRPIGSNRMVPLTALWVPILLSAVLVFLASGVFHMLLPFHRGRRCRRRLLAALRPFAIPPGDYVMPLAVHPERRDTPEFLDKMTKGPVVVMTVLPNGPPAMGSIFGLWFAYCVVMGIFAGYVAGRALGPGAPYLDVFRFVGTVAFVGYSAALWQMSIWFKRSWGTTLRLTIDGLIHGMLTAGAFGWLWPRADHVPGTAYGRIRADDLEKAKEWYAELLGAALLRHRPSTWASTWAASSWACIPARGPWEGDDSLTYWGVPDADKALPRLLELGATVHSPMRDVGEGIRVGTCAIRSATSSASSRTRTSRSASTPAGREDLLHGLDGVCLARRLVRPVPLHPREPQREAARVARAPARR